MLLKYMKIAFCFKEIKKNHGIGKTHHSYLVKTKSECFLNSPKKWIDFLCFMRYLDIISGFKIFIGDSPNWNKTNNFLKKDKGKVTGYFQEWEYADSVTT